ncbi:HNH endonuclease [Halobacillus sp. B29]|uniref:HNH endonuclease n=1 Tax=Halobacillus sp. B29 TaxID=3457432 RepID=UPI003FCC4407
MSIPQNINREHVIEAIQKIDRDRVPKKRARSRFKLSYEGRNYPPKYVISIANIFANDEEYPPSKFSGGDETNRFLRKLGFTIIGDIKNEDEVQRENEDISIPNLEPSSRSREYSFYSNDEKDSVVYEYLFKSKPHRWLDERILEIAPDKKTGHEAMNILHFIGLKDKHKGIFKGYDMGRAINKLEQQDSNFSLVIESLQRYSKKKNEAAHSATKYIELDSIATCTLEQIVVKETEKEQVIKSRIGQSTFKKALLAKEKKCGLCGVSIVRLLVASHIKPWSQSNHKERLDVNNGLLLCPNHDVLFDSGYISFDENGAILISVILDEQSKVFLNINENMNIRMNERQQQYMKWHRENKFDIKHLE